MSAVLFSSRLTLAASSYLLTRRFIVLSEQQCGQRGLNGLFQDLFGSASIKDAATLMGDRGNGVRRDEVIYFNKETYIVKAIHPDQKYILASGKWRRRGRQWDGDIIKYWMAPCWAAREQCWFPPCVIIKSSTVEHANGTAHLCKYCVHTECTVVCFEFSDFLGSLIWKSEPDLYWPYCILYLFIFEMDVDVGQIDKDCLSL